MNGSPDNSITAALLIAHGSRRAAANEDLVHLAEVLRQRNDYPIVEVAYLELVSPTIAEGIATCVNRRADRVLLLPYFLSAGDHVVRDLEHARQEGLQRFPHVEFTLCPPLGRHPLLVDVVGQRLRERLGDG